MNWSVFFVTLSRLFTFQATLGSTWDICESHFRFSRKLGSAIGLQEPKQNVAISPINLQAALMLLYGGASDETSRELKTTLELQSFSSAQLAINKLAQLLAELQHKLPAQLHMPNAIYVQERMSLDFKNEFKHNAQLLQTQAQFHSFRKDMKALESINYWFLQQTNFTLGQFIQNQMLHADINFMLASAFTLQAPWAKAFDVKNTEKLNFQKDLQSHKLVDCMFLAHKFKYAQLNELKAQLLEVPFKSAGEPISLLIFYPNEINGLSALESQLANENLQDLLNEMSYRKVALTLPKFRIEYNGDLKNVLSDLGLRNLFSSAAKFKNMFSSLFSAFNPFVTRVQQKTIFEIDESGANEEASFAFGDIFKRQVRLAITHPFHFVVKTKDVILLAGHIVDV